MVLDQEFFREVEQLEGIREEQGATQGGKGGGELRQGSYRSATKHRDVGQARSVSP